MRPARPRAGRPQPVRRPPLQAERARPETPRPGPLRDRAAPHFECLRVYFVDEAAAALPPKPQPMCALSWKYPSDALSPLAFLNSSLCEIQW